MAAKILLADTVTRLAPEHAGRVVVTGSHGGMIAASYVAQAFIRAAAFNDAGRGCDDAGIAGLAALDGIGIAAFAVAHTSARIGDASGLDSIGLVNAADAGAIVVIGSHGALHGGDPASALPVAARAAFFHDAGRGKDDAGISRLPALAARGLPAAAVDYRSARIGDARSLWTTGIVSAVNAPAASCGIREGMRVRDAVDRFLS